RARDSASERRESACRHPGREPSISTRGRYSVRLPARLERDRIGPGVVTRRSASFPQTTVSPKHLWGAPAFDGPPTGGTVYNAALCEALLRAGVACERVGVDQALRALANGHFDGCWVDTLHLDAVPELVRANDANTPIRLVVHYLPSHVRSDGPTQLS